jgi:hypothetical protein
MFTRAFLIKSDWYKERLRVKQQRDIALWKITPWPGSIPSQRNSCRHREHR